MRTDDRPNILLILNDQHRYDALGCYGNPTIRTPNLDGLANRGVRFDSAYCGILPCSPARASVFTGRYGHSNGVTSNSRQLDSGIPTLASELGRAGYRLGYAGKWHVDNPKNPSDHGFEGYDFPGYGYPWHADYVEGALFGRGNCANHESARHYLDYLGARGLSVPKVVDNVNGRTSGGMNLYGLQTGDIEQSFEAMTAAHTIELLREFSDRDTRERRPFLLWANFWGPHRPMVVPEPYYSMYDPTDIPEDPAYRETFEGKPEIHRRYCEKSPGLEHDTWELWQRTIARYWGYVTMLDELIGRILGELQRLGLAENTIVVFSTDHGDMMGSHRLIEKGPACYEQVYRIPLVVAYPGCTNPGSVSNDFAYLHDLFYTFVDSAGIRTDPVPDGTSILEIIRTGKGTTGRDSIFTEFYRQVLPMDQRMIRTRTHKYVYNRTDLGELYDLVNDPYEMQNLINRPEAQAALSDLRDTMAGHMKRLNDPLLEVFRASLSGSGRSGVGPKQP